MTSTDPSMSRRATMRALVAAGGAGALAACLGESGGVDVPTGTTDPDALPDRQHAWNDVLETDADGNHRPPAHHVLLGLSLERAPTADDRETVEAALRSLERAYEWSAAGLVFTVGYTPAYFDRHGEGPAGVDLPPPGPLTSGEEGGIAVDDFDVLVHLASDVAAVVLEAEEALLGAVDTANGEPVEADLAGIATRAVRRTGFIGPGLPADHTDVPGVPDSVPEAAPFFMGFRSGFRANQATEASVTLADGPFAGGTTQHVSSIGINLEQWLEQDSHDQRVRKLFAPGHEDVVGEVGEDLGTSSQVEPLDREELAAVAREAGVVGHAQKTASARRDGEPILLRRDVNTVDGDRPGLHFVALQGAIEDFVRVRRAMTGADLPVGRLNNGILHYLFVRRRGNYLLPPRGLRSLPRPDGQ